MIEQVQDLKKIQNERKKYTGVVEDNLDPLETGRVRVRIFGVHPDDIAAVPTSNLPWAEVERDTSFGLISGVGLSSVLQNGTYVWVEFDDNDFNAPIVLLS